MKRLLLILCLVLVASSAQAAVAFDANASAACTANSVNLATGQTCATLTIGAGANRAVVCQINLSLQSPSSPTMVWDSGGSNQSMAIIGGQNTTSGTGRSELWGLVNPASGNKTAKYAASSGTSDIDINCVSWTGVDQAGGATSFPHFNSATGTSNTPSVTITSAVGNATMDSTVNDTSTLSAPTKTQTFIDNVPNLISGGGSRTAGAASNVHAWLLAIGSSNWASVGTDILAAGGAACSVSPTLTLLGVGNCAG